MYCELKYPDLTKLCLRLGIVVRCDGVPGRTAGRRCSDSAGAELVQRPPGGVQPRARHGLPSHEAVHILSATCTWIYL